MKIPNSAITASSSQDVDTMPWMGRLNTDNTKTAWCAGENDDQQFLEVTRITFDC